MQKHKALFQHSSTSHTIGDVQRCLRLNDLDEVGDGTHYLDFHMLGLFSLALFALRVGFSTPTCKHRWWGGNLPTQGS